MLSLFAPHFRVQHVTQLTPQWLDQLGLNALMLDVDCTLKRYRSETISAEVADWLSQLQQTGIGLCLVSNGMGQRIGRLAKKLQLPFFSSAMKPFPFRLKAAVQQMGFAPEHTAMVGDQLFADVMAGRLAGLKSIMVQPLHPEEEPWFSRIKRGPERWLLRWMDVTEEKDNVPPDKSIIPDKAT